MTLEKINSSSNQSNRIEMKTDKTKTSTIRIGHLQEVYVDNIVGI